MAASESNPTPVEPAALRAAMARFPTGVTVITAAGEHGPAGLSANAVTSLSLEPPLMLACLDRGSRTLREVERAGSFGVNVLGHDGEPLARRFASKAEMAEKWGDVDWEEDGGIPRLAGAIVWIGCRLENVIGGGDHVIVTGVVESIAEREGSPLLFEGGTYRPLD